jgi:hypothetical protein
VQPRRRTLGFGEFFITRPEIGVLAGFGDFGARFVALFGVAFGMGFFVGACGVSSSGLGDRDISSSKISAILIILQIENCRVYDGDEVERI